MAAAGTGGPATSPARTPRGHLRFLACGSVDDGKSTLIGRLIAESGSLADDEAATLGAGGDADTEPDYSLLLDGLIAEREQGITIDVAYRYFSTPARAFIVADTPGHEQYTRNMATGASGADLAILLVDAGKGGQTQTRRHACIVHLLGIRHVILAVNKMDLADWRQDVFERIAGDFADFARQLGIAHVAAIPVSARRGDNVTRASNAMPWYRGPTLLERLETIEIEPAARSANARLAVQWVCRHDGGFRGYAGTLAAGTLAPGQEIVALPSGRTSRIARVLADGKDQARAAAGDAVIVTLADEIDVGRGDVLADAAGRPECADQIGALVVWMGDQPLLPERQYILRAGPQTVTAQVTRIKYQLNVDNLNRNAATELRLNQIGNCELSLSRPLVFDPYEASRELGGFILVDRVTNATVGCGMIRFALRRAANIHWQAIDIGKAERAALMHQKACCIWLTGLSGSGKSTLANLVEKRLFALGRHTYVLDGDNVRHGLNRDLGFTEADRIENIRRVTEVARLMVDAGLIVIASLISPFRAERLAARERFAAGEFAEVFVDAPLAVCEGRDVKGLYAKARAGRIANFTGITSPYEPPLAPELHLDAAAATAAANVERVIALLTDIGVVTEPR